MSDIDGLSELISDGEGIKVPPNNSERVAEGVIKVISDTEEGKKRVEEIVEKGFKKAFSLNWDKVTEATIGVYAKVLAHAPSGIPAQEKDIEIGIAIGTEKGEIWKFS